LKNAATAGSALEPSVSELEPPPQPKEVRSKVKVSRINIEDNLVFMLIPPLCKRELASMDGSIEFAFTEKTISKTPKRACDPLGVIMSALSGDYTT
jgi:hypothetical protein